MARGRYVSAETFEAVKANQDELIRVLNHNFSELVKEVSKIAIGVANMEGSSKVIRKIVWWILGIVGFIVASVIISFIIGVY